MTKTRIRWEDDGLSGNHVGYAGILADPAFRIFSPDAAHDTWLLSIRIAAGSEFIYGGSREELEARAECWLEAFVSSIGAAFPDEPREGG